MKKNEKKKVLNKSIMWSIICFGLFIILTILVLTKVTDKLDLAIESAIIGIRKEALTGFMTAITNIGGAYCLISLTFLGMLISLIKNKRLPLFTITNLIIVFLTSQLFKAIIHRPRPIGMYLVGFHGYSYPSGHTMVSFAFFTFLAYSMSERINNKFLKIFIKIIAAILILLIAFSRIYLGVHYLTDIIAGYLLGISYILIFMHIRNIIKSKKEVK